MRIPPPSSLRLDRQALLADVLERLQARNLGYEFDEDPTHPAWLLLEEAAWMVESLTEQLDRYPWAIVQQLAHLLGTSLRPARPAVGVVVLQATGPGVLVFGEGQPGLRVLTLQTEARDLIEFVPVEPELSVVHGVVGELMKLQGGALLRSRAPIARDAQQPELAVWKGAFEPSHAFAKEQFQYKLVSTDAAALFDLLQSTLTRWRETRWPGWLRVDVQLRGDRVELNATIDVNAAFDGVAQEASGDLRGVWRALDESTWTPPVRVSDHPVLPAHLRGSFPLHDEEGSLLVQGVPAHMLRDELLVREARPAPSDIPMLLWQTLVHFERKLATLKPEIKRSTSGETGADWVKDALRAGSWFSLARHGEATFAQIRFESRLQKNHRVRIGVVHANPVLSEVEIHACHESGGVFASALPTTLAWTLPLPDPEGRRMWHVTALDVEVPPASTGVLLAAQGEIEGVLLNALLMINAPVLIDEREVSVTRVVPDAVSLVSTDIVSRQVLRDLAGSGLSPSAARALDALGVSKIDVDGRAPILDFEGVALEESEGRLTLLSPDAAGHVRRFARGEQLHLRWYRRTDGEAGNCETGAVSFVEQARALRPVLTGASNPLPTAWGCAAERPEDAMARVFGPPASVPVTPADWEREVRIALGARAQGWCVRVWGYAERSLMSALVWPPHDTSDDDGEREALENALANAGSDTLLVVLGPLQGALAPSDLAWARERVSALVRGFAERVPTVQRAVVTSLHALRVQGEAPGPYPRFSLHEVEGRLVDAQGRGLRVPACALLLNAAIVGTQP